MANSAQLTIDIVADVRKAVAGIDDVNTKLGGIGKGIKGAAIAGAAVAAGGALLSLGKSALEAAEDGRKIGAATEQIIKATGGAANVTTEYVTQYAESLARLTGIDDEAIQAGQNLLLTFNQVKNEVNDGTGIFDRATVAAADLAAAGFGSMESNATQLGKALQDPTKGMSALTRSGVSFTKQEQETIKALQESGDMFAAQNMILKAVEGQVGGTAEASASASDKMQVAWDQALGTIGDALLPIVDKLLPTFTKLLDTLVPAILPVVELVAELATELIDALAPAIEPLIPVVAELGLMIAEELGGVIRQVAPLLPPMIQALAGFLRAILPLIPQLMRIYTVTLPLLPVFTQLITLVLRLATAVLPLLYPVFNVAARGADMMSRALGGLANGLSWLIGKLQSAIGWLERMISKYARIPSGLRRIIPGLSSASFATGAAAAGAATFGAPTRQSTTTRIKVDVTGVGFDSILTGRAITKQLAAWENRNGLTPVQWANRGGLPAGG